MAAVNRFYNPSRGQYVSQFIPQQLPTDLLLQGLANKQKTYNDQLNRINLLGDWTQPALSGYDTEFVNQKKQEIRGFIDNMSQKDLSLPQTQQEYINFTRQLRDNEDLKKVAGSYSKHQEFLDIDKKIKAGNATDYEEAFYDDYLKRFNVYTAKGGKGFKGDIQLGDQNILKGTDIQKAQEELFDHIKADGSESIAALEGGISYKNGWEGVSGKKISSAVANEFDNFYKSRAGEQLGARFDMNFSNSVDPSKSIGMIVKDMTPEQRQQYEAKRREYVMNNTLKTGQTFIYGKSTTNKDQALNEQHKIDMENPQQPAIEVIGNVVDPNSTDWYRASAQLESIKQTAPKLQDQISRVDKIKQLVTNGKLNVNALDAADQELLKGLPLNNPQQLVAELDKIKGERSFQLHNLKTNEMNISERRDNALNKALEGKTYAGMEYKKAKQYFDNIITSGTPEQKAYFNKYQELLQNSGNGRGDHGKFIQEEVTKAIKRGDNKTAVWLGSLNDYNRLQQDAKSASTGWTFNQTYKDAGSYAAPAVLKSSNENYIQSYTIDANGNVSKNGKPGKVMTVDKKIETMAQASPNNFDVYYNGRLLRPGDVNYPDAATLKLVSTNKVDFEGAPTFNMAGKRKPNMFEDPKSLSDNDYVFVGKDIKGFKEAKKVEALNNYMLNPNTDAGQQSYIDFMQFDDPDMATQLAKANGMKTKENLYFNRSMINPETGTNQNFRIEVYRKNDDLSNAFTYKIVDPQTNKTMVPETKADHTGDLGNQLKALERTLTQYGR